MLVISQYDVRDILLKPVLCRYDKHPHSTAAMDMFSYMCNRRKNFMLKTSQAAVYIIHLLVMLKTRTYKHINDQSLTERQSNL